MKELMKLLNSPNKLLLMGIFLQGDRKKYNAFRQLSGEKHFTQWQWRLLDKWHEEKE